MSMPSVKYQDLGRIDYQKAWDYQTGIHKSLVENKLNHKGWESNSYPQAHHLLLCEHPPVYTLGKSGTMDNLLLTEPELGEKGIQFFPINRGGDITYHGPGQIVGYPLLDMECFFSDVHRLVRSIEEVIILTLAEYGIESFRIKEYTGVWVEGRGKPQKRKICAIGIHLSRWVTLHGWAFNVATDLDYFGYIVPCGIVDEDKTVTSLEQELGHQVDMEEVKSHIKRHFCTVFECTLEN